MRRPEIVGAFMTKSKSHEKVCKQKNIFFYSFICSSQSMKKFVEFWSHFVFKPFLFVFSVVIENGRLIAGHTSMQYDHWRIVRFSFVLCSVEQMFVQLDNNNEGIKVLMNKSPHRRLINNETLRIQCSLIAYRTDAHNRT